MNLLRGEFGEHSISRSGPVTWSPKSYDLMPLDNFLWGSVKGHVYVYLVFRLMHFKIRLKHLFVRYRPKCWKHYAKILLSGWTLYGSVAVNICLQ